MSGLLLTCVLVLQASAPGSPADHAPRAYDGPTAVPRGVADLTERERALLVAFADLPRPDPSPTNVWADDPRAARLGRELFFDAGLSAGGEVSCASCHDPQQGWSDGRAQSKGLGNTARNAPSVVNAAHAPWLFWDGRADSLWSQALGPIEAPLEMGGSRLAAVHHVLESERLAPLYRAAFGEAPDLSDRERFPDDARPAPVRPADPFGGPTEADLAEPVVAAWQAMAPDDRQEVNEVFARLGKAIAAFERGLVSGRAPFDVLAAGLEDGDPDKLAALDAEALHGWRLFVGRAGCVSCHFGPTFSDGRFHNLGLPLADGAPIDEGRTDGIRRVRVDPMNGRGAFSDATGWDANQKLLYVRGGEHVLGAYRTPSLRDVTRSAPYGHDGRFATLGDVLDFYAELPGEPAIGHREETLRPLNLSAAERGALLAFLRSLTGPEVPSGRREASAPRPRVARARRCATPAEEAGGSAAFRR